MAVKYEAWPIELPIFPPVSNSTPSAFCTHFIEMLEAGSVTSNPGGTQCCPSCDIYAIGSSNIMTSLLEKVDLARIECCVNIHLTAEGYAGLMKEEVLPETWLTCDTNLQTCVDSVKSSLGQACCDNLESLGIIEIGTLGPDENLSQLCVLLEFLQKIEPKLSAAQICSCLQAILEAGVVVKCLPNNLIFVGSVNAYLDYI